MTQPTSKLSRRSVFVGAGTVGAIAAATSLLPAVQSPVVEPAALPKAPANGGGYSLTEHVKQYYQTARV